MLQHSYAGNTMVNQRPDVRDNQLCELQHKKTGNKTKNEARTWP